jgi:NAD(P)H-flavin reductase
MKIKDTFGDYVRLTVDYALPQKMSPGQCARINDKWFAIAEQRLTDFDIYVKSDSFLLNQDLVCQVTGPTGPGFSNPYADDAVIVAGGTGLGAVMSLANERKQRGLQTTCFLYMQSDLPEYLQEWSQNFTKFEFYNTKKTGRNEAVRQHLEYSVTEPTVFAAGPVGLVNSIRILTSELGLTCSTNY